MKQIMTMRPEKNITYRIAVLFFLLVTCIITYGQSNHKNLRQGDKNYYQKNYLEAEEEYRKALQKNEKSINANHNLGNSLYNQERYDEAAKHFESAALESTDNEERAMSYHNLGNSYLSQMSGVGSPEQGQEILQKGIEAYKQSLKHNPEDDATRYNLAYAQKLFRQFQQQQQQQQQQQENQQQPEGEPSSGDGSGQNQQEDEKEQPKPKPNQGQSMSKEEAERLIQIMEEEERKVQEKMNKKKQQANPSGKDW